MSVTPTSGWHRSAMVASVVSWLRVRPGAVVVDGTVGTGGHSLAILPHLLPDGRLIGVDRDRQALELARQRLTEFEPAVTLLHGNYRHLPQLLERLGVARLDGLLLDLGMSSLQVDSPGRGFSFSREGPLDMRMDPDEPLTAAVLVNEWSADDLAMILKTLGEERHATRIARQIVQVRQQQPITTTTQLAQIVARVVPGARRYRLHPATRTFQALRLAVNDELGALQEFLGRLDSLLAPGGRAVVLTYHSLEDRLVKRAFAQGMREGRWMALTPKPERPTAAEVEDNPRVRSAKLRAIERALGCD